MTDQTPLNPDTDDDHEVTEPELAPDDVAEAELQAPPQYGVGPFSIREVVLTGIWLLAFLFSFFSLISFGFASVWTEGLLWVLTIGVPTVAVFLIVLRRLSPTGIRRVGSLGIDQFASVAFSVSAFFWLQFLWQFWLGADGGPWVAWVELILMVAGVVFTVLAPVIPVIGDDFDFRAEVPAHRSARPLRPIAARPTPAPRPAPAPAPAADQTAAPQTGYPVTDPFAAPATTSTDAYPQAEATTTDPANTTASYDTGGFTAFSESFDATGDIALDTAGTQEQTPVPAAQQPFWALAPVEREVLDELGAPLFVIGPTAWALVIEDRGEVFVVRHEDGRIGYLHDVTGVTRG
jgi:hypothetical protein